MARSLLDLFRLRREQSRLRKKQLQRQISYTLQNKPRGTGRVRSEAMEPRNLLAAVPIALDDFANFTNSGTDLVVSGSSNPGPVIANDTDVDLGSKTASVVSNPSSGSLLSFGTDGTFTYRPNGGFVGVDSFSYKINDGTLDSNVSNGSHRCWNQTACETEFGLQRSGQSVNSRWFVA